MAETQLTVFISAPPDALYKKEIERFDFEFRERVRFHHSHGVESENGGAGPTTSATSVHSGTKLDAAVPNPWRRPSVLPLWVGEPRHEGSGVTGDGGDPVDFVPVRCPAHGSRSSRQKSPMEQLLQHARKCQCQEDMVLVTYTSPDALFPQGFWGALTCAFLTSGVRHTTIWQAPVFPLKDHLQQGFAIRHASFFLSQSQLASLSDPVAVPLPKSTCSLPLELLRQVDSCWDPHIRLPSHDWSTGLWTKCWLTTIGRCLVQPIFQPVLRRATQDRTCVPSGSLRVHSRGMLELVYFFVALPLALMRIGGSRTPPMSFCPYGFPLNTDCRKRSRTSRVGRGRLFCLFLRSVPPVCGVALAHVNISSWLFALCLNGIYLLYYSFAEEKVGTSGSILLGLTAQILGFCIFPLLMFSNAALISHLPPECVIRAEAARDEEPEERERRRALRRCGDFICLMLKGILAGPLCHFTAFWMHWRTALGLLRWDWDVASFLEGGDYTDWYVTNFLKGGDGAKRARVASGSGDSPPRQTTGDGVLHAGAFGWFSRFGTGGGGGGERERMGSPSGKRRRSYSLWSAVQPRRGSKESPTDEWNGRGDFRAIPERFTPPPSPF